MGSERGGRFDHPIFGQIVAKGARLTTDRSQAVGISEYVLATVLDHFQRGPERRAAQAQRIWARLNFSVGVGAGSRWLVIGFGAIGQAVGLRARAFGAHVTGVQQAAGRPARRPTPWPPPARSCGCWPPRTWSSLPCRCRPRPGGIVDAPFLAAMKPGSVLSGR